MNIFQAFQSLTPASFQQQHLVLRHGQIVNATLLDILPNGDAKISFQGHIVRAKIESPLAKGEHTFMQVKGFHDGTVTMRIITNSEKKASNINIPVSNINDLLKNMKLPQNPPWRELTQQLITKNIPLLPEILQNGVEVLGKEPTREQQQTWMNMLERGLPINQATFLSVHQLLYGQPINSLINKFQQIVNQFLETKIAALSNTQQVQSGNFQQTNANAMQSTMNLQPTTLATEPTLNSLIHTNNNGISSPIASAPAPATTTQNINLSQNITTSQSSENSKLPIPNTSQTTNQVAAVANVSQNIQSNEINPDSQKNQSAQIAQSSQNIQSAQIAPSDQNIQSTQIPNSTQNQQPVQDLIRLNQLFEVLLNNTTQLSSNTNASTTNDNHLLATILKLVGYQHENKVQALFQDFQQPMQKSGLPPIVLQSENIKQLLLQVISNNNYSMAIRELATQLVNNVNGQQLLSLPQDSNNLLQNMMLQIPIMWNENQHDTLTLQIQGRKERKTIDPENCSIYIELTPPNIGDLGIYIHIVNKVVSIRLLSENEQLKVLTKLTEETLKQGLSEQGYKLSYIKIESMEQAKHTKKKLVKYGQASQTGFDIRI